MGEVPHCPLPLEDSAQVSSRNEAPTLSSHSTRPRLATLIHPCISQAARKHSITDAPLSSLHRSTRCRFPLHLLPLPLRCPALSIVFARTRTQHAQISSRKHTGKHAQRLQSPFRSICADMLPRRTCTARKQSRRSRTRQQSPPPPPSAPSTGTGSSKDGSVRVAIRIRPLVQMEKDEACLECIETVPNTPQVRKP